MPSLSLIVAHDRHRLIGKNGDLPWRLPSDLRRFRALTVGNTVLMGRKTWDSLPRRPLPDRENRVLSRDPAFVAPGARTFTSLSEALAAPMTGSLFVIGGADLYRLTLPLATHLHITWVDAAENGDTWFPCYEKAGFREITREDHAADSLHPHPYSFLTLERCNEATS